MRIPIAQIEWQSERIAGVIPDHILHVVPLPDWEHGRKAVHMADAWEVERATSCAGMIWVDHDIAADPDDLAAMLEAISARPAAMLTGVVKLWPASTSRDAWIWSHRGGLLGSPVPTQDEQLPVAYISTGFLYTPRLLLDLARPIWRSWRWEQVDVGLSELALAHDISIYTVPNCRPKHLHF